MDGEIFGHLPTSDTGPPPVVKSQANTPGFSTSLKSFDPTQLQEMLGRTYLTKPDSNENIYRARVVRAITEMDESRKLDPKYICFIVKLNDPNKTKEIIAYNDLVDFVLQEIERDSKGKQYYCFKRICAHQGPYTKDDPEYNGSTWNVQIE